MVNQMKTKKLKKQLPGRRFAMEPFNSRIPPDKAEILRKAAKKFRCKCADLLRSAWLEYIDNHDLENEIAK